MLPSISSIVIKAFNQVENELLNVLPLFALLNRNVFLLLLTGATILL